MLVSMTSVAILLILLTETIPSVQPTTFRTRSAPDNLPGCVSVFEESRITPCYCDPACKFYGDCCHEYRHTAKRLFQCVDLSSLSVSNRGFAFVFNRCPPGTNEERKQLCERPVRPSDGPDRSIVIASDDMRLFRNVHCALCHEAIYREPISKLRCRRKSSLDRFRSVKNRVYLRDVMNTSVLLRNLDCKLETQVDQYRRCHASITTRCPNSWKRKSRVTAYMHWTTADIKKNCLLAPTRYARCEGDVRIYRNLFCLACHRENCKHYRRTSKPIASLRKDDFRYSYTILTDFTLLSDASKTDATVESVETMPKLAFSILTASFCVLSGVSLVLLIIVFAVVPKLHNFGGVLTLALASSLLVGLLCFLVGPHIEHFPILCRIVGAVMYFAYLSSFAWMSLFALDVLRTLTLPAASSSAIRSSSIGRRFAKVAVGGWLLPLVVTLAAVTVDVVWPQSAVSARFGRGQCYFNNGHALLGWFYAPVSVAVVANVAMSVAVNVVVWRVMQQSRFVRGDNESAKQMIRLCMKITSIFGGIWILGLSAVLIKNEWFTEIAGLINCLQGVLVSFSFLFNSKIKCCRKTITSNSASGRRTTSNTNERRNTC